MSRVVALIASHNRREKTLACLAALFGQDSSGHEVDVVLVDDGSVDGTAEAAQAFSDRIDVVRGDGSLHWARAMALAEQYAASRRPEHLLWLNDDVVLFPDALDTLMSARDVSTDRRIVAGLVVDPRTGIPTYGGADRVDWHPMRYSLVAPTAGQPRPVMTFHGNVVLVPRPVYEGVGGIDGRFSHAYADFDYGLRARALGFQSVVSARAVGTCRRESGSTWSDASLPLIQRYRLIFGRKGVPVRSSARYLRRHGGRLWPMYLSATYVKLAVEHVRARRGPERAERH